MQEGAEARLDLPEDRPHIIARLLQFLYTGNYDIDATPAGLGLPEENTVYEAQETPDPENAPAKSPNTEVVSHLKIYALVHACAEKYDIDAFRTHAAKCFKDLMLDQVSPRQLRNVVEVVNESNQAQDSQVKEQIYRFCIRNQTTVDNDLNMLFQKEAPMLWTLAWELRDELKASRTRTTELEQQVKNLEDLMENNKKSEEKKRDYLHKVVKEIDTLVHCPICGVEYMHAPYFSFGRYRKRCNDCMAEWIVVGEQ